MYVQVPNEVNEVIDLYLPENLQRGCPRVTQCSDALGLVEGHQDQGRTVQAQRVATECSGRGRCTDLWWSARCDCMQLYYGPVCQKGGYMKDAHALS